MQDWAKQLGSKKLDTKKETELLPAFVSDVFEGALDYTRPPADPYTLKRETHIEVDGKRADAGLGRFTTKGDTFVADTEWKLPMRPSEACDQLYAFLGISQGLDESGRRTHSCLGDATPTPVYSANPRSLIL